MNARIAAHVHRPPEGKAKIDRCTKPLGCACEWLIQFLAEHGYYCLPGNCQRWHTDVGVLPVELRHQRTNVQIGKQDILSCAIVPNAKPLEWWQAL